MQNYLDLLSDILREGKMYGNRTRTRAVSVFGKRLSFNLQRGFPLVTTKKIFFRGVVEELLWILRGETNIKSLNEKGVHIWDEWADENGGLGPVYGHQWRNFGKIDQIVGLINGILNNPRSRRHVVSGWNPLYLPNEGISPQANVAVGNMALAPCHLLFQCYVRETIEGSCFLDIQVTMRSVDSFLGMPFNIASYAALTHILAFMCDARPGQLTMVFGDTHIYENHIPQVLTQIDRVPRALPSLKFEPACKFDGRISYFIESLSFQDFQLTGYDPYPAIAGDISV